MTSSSVLLVVLLAQTVPAPAPVKPAEVRDVRCPDKLDKAACSKLTSVVVSLAQTSMSRKKLRTIFAGTAVNVEIRDAAIQVSASSAPDRLEALVDAPMRLQWDASSASFVVTGSKLRAIFDALQEFLAVLAPELTMVGLPAFERAGTVTLLIQSGTSHLHLAVDRSGKRMFLGAASPKPELEPNTRSPAPSASDEEARRQNPY